jgi:hypothetical protein
MGHSFDQSSQRSRWRRRSIIATRDPPTHLRALRLLRALQLDVAAPIGVAEWRRWIEVRTAEEDDVHGDVIGDQLDDPTKLR